MPYVGDRLTPLFDGEPTERAAKRLAEKGPEEMQSWIERNTPVDMGTLRASWYTTEPVEGTGLTAERTFTAYVRTDVEYAPHVEWGTGIFGPQGSPYTIRPRQPGGTLSWIDKDTGERVFAKSVQHPGSPGQHMVSIGAAMTEHTFPAAAQPILQVWKRETEALAG